MGQTAKSFKDFLLTSFEILQPGIIVDSVIFGFNEGEIKVLLNRYKAHPNWMLPGGFVCKDEGIEEAAGSLLKKRTGLKNCYLRQFSTFGEPDEAIIEENKQLLREYGMGDMDSHWLLDRYVNIGYYAFVNYNEARIKPTLDEECGWFGLSKLPSLFCNHRMIIDKAIQVIRMEINYIPIGLGLLPEKFTISELRVIYETILGKSLDRRNFQRKILSCGYIYKLDEISRKWGVKDAALYAFNKEKYLKAMEQGMDFF
ncbi:MAG: NUDIX hydrolase [Dysgonamonadaceae bacterium]|jgi:hypothetical protein|nr:NUDIX hydrolase [Dysgonamonadaceae bacterium]